MEFMNKTIYQFSNVRENVEIIIYSLLAFFVPFLIGHPQMVVGIIINLLLLRVAFYTTMKNALPVIVLPSIAVYFRGALFGVLTAKLIYMIPFIILGNFLMVFLAKKYFQKNKSINEFKISSHSLFGIISKVILIGLGTVVLYLTGVVPLFFVTTMATLQIVTACSALVIFFANLKLNSLLKKNY